MFQEHTTVLRTACENDISSLHALEERVWKNTGVPPLPGTMLKDWMHTNPQGFIVAVKGEAVCGYVYAESIDFNPTRLEDPAFHDLVQTGCLKSRHEPQGNTLHGMSIATERPGVGVLLLKEITRLARAENKEYLVAFTRMPGLARFIENVRQALCQQCAVPEETLAHAYAAQCLALVDGSCAPSYVSRALPENAPRLRKKDPVLCLFATVLGVALYDVCPTPFPDPPSANYAAFVARSYR